MPCRFSDELYGNVHEQKISETRRVSSFIMYLCAKMGYTAPDWAHQDAESIYVNINHLDMATALLCKMCQEAPEHVLYNIRDRQARELLTWWEDHQEADTKRVIEEKQQKADDTQRNHILAKLTANERRILGV